jgi:hypothetical protein
VIEIADLQVAEDVARAVAAAGHGLLEMSETRTNLEGLFLGLTAGAAP